MEDALGVVLVIVVIGLFTGRWVQYRRQERQRVATDDAQYAQLMRLLSIVGEVLRSVSLTRKLGYSGTGQLARCGHPHVAEDETGRAGRWLQ
jgi:hypothetical protein